MIWLGSRPVLQLAFAQAIMMSVNTMLLTLSSIVGFQLAQDKSLATLPIAIQFCATMLTTIPAALWMGKFGRKSGFFIASLLGCLGAVIGYVAISWQSFLLLNVATLFVGIYTGFGNYFRFVAVEVSADQYKNNAISYVLLGGIIAAVVGPNLAVWSRTILPLEYLGSFVMILLLYGLNFVNFSLLHWPVNRLSKSTEAIRPLFQIVKQPVFIVALSTALLGFSIMALLMTATPLSMQAHQHSFPDVAFIIQWHVLGMFVPSFFTGHLLNRFGFTKVTLSGAMLMIIAVATNLLGTQISHYWIALVALGIGWNFLFISATSKLTEAYSKAEKAKTQAMNDFLIFSFVTLASLGAGVMQFHYGWANVNLMVLPFIMLNIGLILWLYFHEKRTKTKPLQDNSS